MDRLKVLFKKLGFTDTQYNNIINDPGVTLKSSTLYENFVNNVTLFLDNGYKKKDIVRLVFSNHNLTYLNLNKKIEMFSRFGYDQEAFFKMLKKSAKLVNLGEQNLNDSLDNFNKLGYSSEVIYKMTIVHPALFSYSVERVKTRIKELEYCGYNRDEVLKLTCDYPAIFGSDAETLNRKLRYYNLIGLHEYILERPKDLIQSVELTYARYNFFRDSDMEMNKTNMQSLFKREEAFKKQYGFSNKGLLAIYRFSNYESCVKGKTKIKENDYVQ